ncbi:hypothetical protein EIN_317000 [Entamoeba invadens IP1]|uniref:Uncharacterized protein n=1 Tax=Entamoeba invadens IP1 TaxID=370355 RepID=A0A0A1U5C6_ENTIV|nr:hypothetical protein EIN_317000 [Entamoeba invadens IP1]ELP86971.1 hypothetical protein EIN_317000 [Entamoeba invadens IP1]|eukprot:XP_004253742.1 hypothetical protein EIN_317000 [Entamoeba invadens IP1]
MAVIKIKLVVMGDSDVGKSAILHRFIEGTFTDGEKPANPQKGVFLNKDITVDKQQVHFDIVDLAFDVEATASDFQGARAGIAVFDYSNPDTLKNTKNQLGLANRFVSGPSFASYIVGNKTDLEKKTDDAEVNSTVTSANATKLYQISAKTGDGINEMFEDIAKAVLATDKPAKEEKGGKKKGEKKGGCAFL